MFSTLYSLGCQKKFKGPWRAAERFLGELRNENLIHSITRIKVDLYGSLSLTGKGHATDLAIMLGLSGQDPEYLV